MEAELVYLDLRRQSGIQIGSEAEIFAFYIQPVQNGNMKFPKLHPAVESLRQALDHFRVQYRSRVMDRILPGDQPQDDQASNKGQNRGDDVP